ncbi:hypothetical protein [Aliiroseovarius sp. PrR006]|uniref:hypothetical protein n=1 Tax=Aliiroseovarius sp. PrR006 TaxID=2706883 RepID=UPI0013D8C475|nr:hypothetical protein [Aliiroseovarius sp. PrR006]NDW52354.1 hypothetical protein [Aliiroseovarius sp. PrR006]
MQRRFAFLVSLFCGLWISKALANDVQICRDVVKLQVAYSQTQGAPHFVDAVATKRLISSLSQHIKRVRDFNMPVGVVSPSDALGAIAAALDRAVAQSGNDAQLASHLSSLREELELLTVVFGCEFVPSTEVAGSQRKPLVLRHLPSEGQAGERGGAGDPIVLSGGVLGFLTLLAALLARIGLRGRAKREVCNTPVLVSIKSGCTITRIVDINRNGMKIEAAPIHTQDACVDLYFCGHACRGKIRWKNEYFAGIQFKKRIPQATVADVVERSQSTMEGSGLEKNTIPCYRSGCHEGCGKYCPSAMAERAFKEHDQSHEPK